MGNLSDKLLDFLILLSFCQISWKAGTGKAEGGEPPEGSEAESEPDATSILVIKYYSY